MQRNVLLAGCAVILVIAGGLALRSVTRHQAGQVLDRGVDQLLANLPPGYTVRHGATDYNPLTGSATVHDLAVTQADGAVWTADSLTVSGADGRALQDVFDPNAYPNGHPAWTDRRPLIGNIAADHVHASVPGPKPGEFSADRLTWHGLSGRPFAVPPTPENRASRRFAADAALAFALDSQTARGLMLASGGPTSTRLAVGSIEISNYDAGKLGAAMLKTIAIDAVAKVGGAPIHLTIDSMDIKEADGRAVLRAVQRDGQAGSAALGTFSYGSADLAGLAVQLPAGPAISVHDFHAEQSSADAAGAHTWQGSQHGLTVALGEMAVPPVAAPGLAAFGMTALKMDLEAAGHISPPLHTIDITEDLHLHDLGTLHVQGSFSGYDPAAATPEAKLVPFLASTVEHATIVWQDDGLTNRLFKVAAVQAHSTPDVVRAQLAMPIVALGVMVPDQPDAADQVTTFLNHPGKLTITIAPPQPVTIAQVGAAPATQRAHLLGVHVQAN